MSVTLPAESIATVVVGDVNSAFASSPQDVLDNVAAQLNAEGYQVINTSYSGVAGLLASLAPLAGAEFQGTWQIEVGYQTDTDSLIATVLAAISDETGVTSTQATIPAYTLAGSSAAISTGMPGATPTAAQAASSVLSSAGSGITAELEKFFAGIKSTTTTLLIAIAAIVVIVLVLVAYGPNVKHIAAAAI